MSKLNEKTIDKKLSTFKNVSTKIRYLDSVGYSRSQIKSKLNIIYQHVRNVLITPITNPKEKF